MTVAVVQTIPTTRMVNTSAVTFMIPETNSATRMTRRIIWAAMMSINAAKGFEYGEGFEGVTQRGSEQNDVFVSCRDTTTDATDKSGKKITTLTNHSGGIQGGISNGQDIYFRVAFKPVATLLREQQTVDKDGNPTTFKAQGRHDPCVLPRAVPVVEAMAALVILDNLLLNKTVKMQFLNEK